MQLASNPRTRRGRRGKGGSHTPKLSASLHDSSLVTSTSGIYIDVSSNNNNNTSSTVCSQVKPAMTAPPSQFSGGFLPSPQSPAPSTASTSVSATTSAALPHPRSRPLRAGSSKEEAARRYVDDKLLHVSRRYTKRFQPAEPDDTVVGYASMREVCKDLNDVVDVLWLSGTREFF